MPLQCGQSIYTAVTLAHAFTVHNVRHVGVFNGFFFKSTGYCTLRSAWARSTAP